MLFKDGALVCEGADAVQKIVLEQGRKTSLVLVAMGSGEALFDIDIDGPDAEVDLRGLYVCRGEDRLNVRVNMRHNAGGSISVQMFRGIADGNARVNFDGRIVVAHDAQKTEAYQTCHNLQLSDTSSVQASPQLEIYADDVKCSHGATVGSLNEDEQFYMRSRGISEAESKRLQMISFLTPVMEGLPDKLRKSLHKKVFAYL